MSPVRMLLIAGMLMPLACPPATAQDSTFAGLQADAATRPQAESEGPRSALDSLDSLESVIAARSAAISQDVLLDPATRDAALSRLRDARGLLQSAAADRAETARLAAERDAAPALLRELAGDGSAPDDSDALEVGPAPSAPIEPPEWNRLSLAQLEIEVSDADNSLRAARQKAADTGQLLAELRRRRPLFGADLAAARDALADAAGKVVRVDDAGQPVEGTGSEQLFARAQRQARAARLAYLEELSSGADVREQLLAAQASAAQRDVARRDAELQAMRAELARRRLAEAVAQSSEWQDSAVGGFAAVAAIAHFNRELAGLYGGASSVTTRIDQVQRDLANLEHVIVEFGSETTELQARLEVLGRTFAAGILIRQGIEQLPSSSAYQERLKRRRSEINEAQLQRVELAGQLRRLERDLPGESLEVVSTLTGLAPADRDEALKVVGGLLEARRKVLQPLLNDLDKLLNGLVELQAREQALVKDVAETRRYLRSRQPWVRNARRVTFVEIPAALAAVGELTTAQFWSGGGRAMAAQATRQPGESVSMVAAIVIAALALFAVHLPRRQSAAQRSVPDQRFQPMRVLGAALLSGLAWLSLVAIVGWWLTRVPDAPAALHALGRSLLQVGPGAFMAGFMLAFFSRSGGIGSIGPALAASAGRARPLVWYLVSLLVLLVISGVLWAAASTGTILHGDVGARLALLIAALIMAVGLHRAIGRRLLDVGHQQQRGSLMALVLYAVAACIPLTVVVLLAQGFTIAAYDLSRALLGTLLVLFIGGTVRVLFLGPGSNETPGSSEWSALREGRLDLMHVLVTLAVLAGLYAVWRDVFAGLLYLQHVPLWTAETVDGIKTVTVANLLSCITVLGGTLIAFWALPLVLPIEASDSTQRSVGTRYAIIALVRYTVLIVGLVAAFSLLNIGWSKLQWMAAGLSVGLGFGLQETVANFFSGLTLLSERSIRVGDLVTVGDKTGIVRRIKVRATTVEDFDGREVIIPNKELVSTQVTNWTLTDAKRRLQVVVGVAYGSDTSLVVRMLLEAAGAVEGILAQPPPQAVFEQFGDSALQFRLYVWIDVAQGAVQINHELHMRIDRLFRDSGIAIDFPQRDVHLFPAGPIDVRLSRD